MFFSVVKLWQGISLNGFQSLPQDYLIYCKRYMISGEATIRIGHGEVFLKEIWPRILSKCLEDISDGVLLLLNLNVVHTRSNWLCCKTQEEFQVESGFCKTIGCSYVALLTTYLANKTMLKVSNKNIRKRCLLMSKITLKTLGRRHLTTRYLPEVTVQNHILDSFC